MGLQVEEIEPPRRKSCEAEEKNMKERGKKRAENEKGGRISYREKGGSMELKRRKEEKRQRNKGCPPESWHAEGQHLLRIIGPALERWTLTHTHMHTHTHSPGRMAI